MFIVGHEKSIEHVIYHLNELTDFVSIYVVNICGNRCHKHKLRSEIEKKTSCHIMPYSKHEHKKHQYLIIVELNNYDPKQRHRKIFE